MEIYALCDQELLDSRSINIDDFVLIAKKNNATILQYRNKTSDLSFIKQQLIRIRKNFDGFLIVNDKYELVEYCDGVHLGQEDLQLIDSDVHKAVQIIRSVINKDKILGISTHNEEEVLQANEMDLNYIGLGAYRDTTTKTDIQGILGDKIDTIAAKSKHLVGVIGGVKLDDNFSHVRYKVIGSGLL